MRSGRTKTYRRGVGPGAGFHEVAGRGVGFDAVDLGGIADGGLPEAVPAGSLPRCLGASSPPGLDPRVADHAVEPSPEGSRPAAQQGGVILPPGQTHDGRLHVQGRPPALTPRRSSSPSAMRRL